MNRRGFFGLLGKLLAVGAAIGVAPELLSPVQNALPETISGSATGTLTEAQATFTFTYPKPDYTLAE